MRQVILDGRGGVHSAEVPGKKLAGHLNVRLREYEEEGISSHLEGGGVVTARFSGLDGEAAVRALAEAGVYACAEGERVRFVIGPDTSFEDLDYVQAAAAELL